MALLFTSLGMSPLFECLGIPPERLGVPLERLGIPPERLGVQPTVLPYLTLLPLMIQSMGIKMREKDLKKGTRDSKGARDRGEVQGVSRDATIGVCSSFSFSFFSSSSLAM